MSFKSMESDVPSNIQNWIRRCLRKEFEFKVQKALEENGDTGDIVKEIIESKQMDVLMNYMKIAVVEQSGSRCESTVISDTRSVSSLSCISDQISEDWNSLLNNEACYNVIIEKMNPDKPTHVRLAAYEVLLKNELSNLNDNPAWDSLQNASMNGLIDDSRAIFEASLQLHAKLLSCIKTQDVHTNLLNAFNSQYRSQKMCETLPTLISGINFKFFLHERLFRIIHLIITYHDEILKSSRNIDKNTEEVMEQFIMFLSTHDFQNAMHPKTLNILNIISVLQPHARWSRKWMISLATRRIFLAALGKSPSLLQQIIHYVQKGLEELPYSLTISICEDPMEVIVNGNTIHTATYLHSLCFISQLCAYQAGRDLLSGVNLETPFSVSQFLTASLRALNKLSIETSNGAYDSCCYALQFILDKPAILYDTDFYHVALCHLPPLSENNVKICPHILNIIIHMLNTYDGSQFLISECKEHTVNFQSNISKCPAAFIIVIASNMLRQPLSLINVECLLKLLKVVEKLFDIFDVYEIVHYRIETEFYPSVSYFYGKLNKCYFENEIKAQQINSAVNALLLKIVSIPSGLKALVQRTAVFQELIEGSIAPLRASWASMEVVNFVSSAPFFHFGYNVIANLAPHVLSTLLSEIWEILEDPEYFYDPWDHENIQKFLHIVTFFSLNFKCFCAFMTNTGKQYNNDEENSPLNLAELFHCSINPQSNYYYLGLLCLNAVIWNLNISLYLMALLDFQNTLLEFQNSNAEETQTEEEAVKYIDDCTVMRHKALCKTYFIKCRYPEEIANIAEYNFPILPPQKPNENIYSTKEYDTELENSLCQNKPGLLDSNWVKQIREAYKLSPEPITNTVLIQLVDQMHKAIPTAEWVENFYWEESSSSSTDFWFEEEMHGVNMILYYAKLNDILEDTGSLRDNFQRFINASYEFIQYKRPTKFDEFDWFLSAIFLICKGDIDRCKTFLTQIIQFPVTIFLWSNLGKVMDKHTKEECGIQFTFMQLLGSIVSNELSHIIFALKSTCGMDWSLICSSMLSQSFFGILPWPQIMHFFAICILFSPDYLVYYCVSLLNHCQNTIMEDITNGKMWPEYMDLSDYQCHDYIRFMDSLDKRYGNNVLPKLSLKGIHLNE